MPACAPVDSPSDSEELASAGVLDGSAVGSLEVVAASVVFTASVVVVVVEVAEVVVDESDTV